MKQFITYADTARFKENLSESVILSKAYNTPIAKNTFLSHSSKDNTHIPGILSVLNNHGARVYVDNLDNSLPRRPSVQTAQILRDSLKSCKNFILMVSPNSKESRWIPWELGLADGEKGSRRVALFPIAPTSQDQDWAEQEYLGLYDRIIYGEIGDSKPGWIVLNHHKNTAYWLRKWLE